MTDCPSSSESFVDTDFVGLRLTRRSTSGGCALLGDHLVKRWPMNQEAVTFSSGEAELGGVVKGAGEGLAPKRSVAT